MGTSVASIASALNVQFGNPPSLVRASSSSVASAANHHPPAAEKEKRPTTYDANRALQVFTELVQTEARYVEHLTLLASVYLEPCIAACNERADALGEAAGQARVQMFFSAAIQILALNSKLYEDLNNRLQAWSETTNVGEVFVHYAPLFKMYGTYAKDHEIVTNMLSEAAKNSSKWSDFVTKANQDERLKGQTLESLLIMPVQRVPRYKLLLEEIRRKTPDSHPGYPSLMGALEQVGSAAMHINESIRMRERREQLLLLEKKFIGGIDLRDSDHPRYLLREGELVRLTRRGQTVYYFHLFNDLLLYSEQTVKGFKLHRRVDMSDRVTISTDVPEEHGILVSSPQKSFVVCARTAELRDAWLQALQQSVHLAKSQYVVDDDDISGQAKKEDDDGQDFVAPVWTQDSSGKTCTLCHVEFTFIRRRHHCRRCGALVCNACSSHKMLIQAIHKSEMQRVCEPCFLAAGGRASGPSSPTSRSAASTKCIHKNCSNKREPDSMACAEHADVAYEPSQSDFDKARGRFADSRRNSFSTKQQRARTLPFKLAPVPKIDPNHPDAAHYGIGPHAHHSASQHSLHHQHSTVSSPPAAESLSAMSGSVVSVFSSGWRDRLDDLTRKHGHDDRFQASLDFIASEYEHLRSVQHLLLLYVQPILKIIEDSSGHATASRSKSAGELDGKKVPPVLAMWLTSLEPVFTLTLELDKHILAKIEEWDCDNSGLGDLFTRYAPLFTSLRQVANNQFRAIDVLKTSFLPLLKRLQAEAARRYKEKREREEKRERLAETSRSRRSLEDGDDLDGDLDDDIDAMDQAALARVIAKKALRNRHAGRSNKSSFSAAAAANRGGGGGAGGASGHDDAEGGPGSREPSASYSVHRSPLPEYNLDNMYSSDPPAPAVSSSSSSSSSSSHPPPLPPGSAVPPPVPSSAVPPPVPASALPPPLPPGTVTTSSPPPPPPPTRLSDATAIGQSALDVNELMSPSALAMGAHSGSSSTLLNGLGTSTTNLSNSPTHGGVGGVASSVSRASSASQLHASSSSSSSDSSSSSLSHLALLPLRRMAQYAEFLSTLLSFTPAEHAEHDKLSAALTTVQNMAADLEKAETEGRTLALLTSLASRFVALTTTDGQSIHLIDARRRLLHKGDLARVTRVGSSRFYFHLFNDALMYSEVLAGNKFKMHRWLPLLDLQLYSEPTGGSSTDQFAFNIITPQKQFTVRAASDEDRKAWMDAIKAAIVTLYAARANAPPAVQSEGALAMLSLLPPTPITPAAISRRASKSNLSVMGPRDDGGGSDGSGDEH